VHQMTRLSLVLSLLLMSACSGTTFIYNRLDFLVPWYLDDYVELNRVQKSSLDGLLEPYLQWHRQEELPRYLVTLVAIEQTLESDIQAEDIAQLSVQFEEAWERLEGATLEWMMALGDQLSDAQIEEFLANLQKQQHEYEEEFLPRSEEEYFEENYDNLLDSFQDYLGRLNKSQREILKLAAADFQRFDAAWLTERAAWLQRLEELLQREPDWQQRLLAAIALRDDRASRDYLARYEHNIELVQQSMASVLNSRTDKQDRRLRKKLANLREDLETLISDKD
jgi:hypothetical protein